MQTTTNLTTQRTIGRYGQDIDIIGVHTMEAPEGPNTAESIADYFKRVKASSHWCVDNNSRVRVVEDKDTAWTLPGANTRSLNIELAGYARQTVADWADQYSLDMLEIAAQCAAEWVIKYNIPIRRLTDAQIRSGAKGFAGHVDVNRVYKQSTHWDPGPAFPWDYFLGRVSARIGGAAPVTSTSSQEFIASLPKNSDGSLRIDQDGIRGRAHIGRWQEVMGTPIDFEISKPESSLIKADQAFLNKVVDPRHIKSLTGKNQLLEDGDEGEKTVQVRQYWLRTAMGQQHQGNLIGHLLEFDGFLGAETNKIQQFALNQATRGSKRYGDVP